MEPLVFPIGHYLGAYFPGAGAPLERYEIRIGRGTYALGSTEEAVVWLRAHGRPASAPLTWREYRGRLGDEPMLDAAGVAEELAEDGLLATVDPEDAAGFAAEHRVLPLRTSIGDAPGVPPQWYAMGDPGEIVAVVDGVAHWLWLHGHLHDNLWQASVALAGGGDPIAALGQLLARLHSLLAVHAICLDVAYRPD